MTHKSSDNTPRLVTGRSPVVLLSVTLFLSCAILAALGYGMYLSQRQTTERSQVHLEIEDLCGTIMRLDEALTMSANMAAATGDLRWEKRYHEFEPVLDAAINKAERLAPHTFGSKGAAETDAANVKLVAMEKRAFRLVREGRHADAQSLLSSKQYLSNKRIYAAGMDKVDADIHRVAGADGWQRKRSVVAGVLVLLSVFLLLLTGWWAVLRSVRGWTLQMEARNNLLAQQAEELDRWGKSLDEKVAGRTAKLVSVLKERDRANEMIRDREEELAAIYLNAPFPMLLIDAERRIRKTNKCAEDYAGASSSDLLGSRGGEALRCLHALDDPQGCGFGPHCRQCGVRLTVLDTLETRRGHHQVETMLSVVKDGKPQEIAFLLSTAAVDVRGDLMALVTIQDITERKRADDKLRESEERYRTLFSSMSEGFALCEMIFDDKGEPCDFRYLEANSAFERHTGWPIASVIGKTVRQILPNIEQYWIESYGRIVTTGEPARLKGRIEELDRDFEAFAFSPAEGRFAAIFMDVTERRRAEEALQSSALFPDENPFPVLRISDDGTVTYANRVSSPLLKQWRCKVGGRTPARVRSWIREALSSASNKVIDVGCGDQVFSLVFAPMTDKGYVNVYGEGHDPGEAG